MLSGHTRLAAVIGHPVRHSLSPAIHNAAFDELGLDWVYLAFDVESGRAEGALGAMRDLGIDGLSVTMPHKTDVARAVDECSPSATALDAVNCVQRVGRKLVGHNTDGDGFVAALRADGIDPDGQTCGVVGAGGAGRAVIDGLARAGATEIVVVNRNADRASEAAQLGGGVGRVGALAELADLDLLVHATSVGMGEPDVAHDMVDHVGSGQVVADLVYNPRQTALLTRSERSGARTVDGLGMLVHQAGLAFTLWTGEVAPIAKMMDAVVKSVDPSTDG